MKRWIPLLLCLTTSLFGKEFHPITKLNHWLKEEKEKTAGHFRKFATLATVSSDGHPHTRMIEIIGLSRDKGALFFTHKNTGKVQDLGCSPHAALNIWLPHTLRQVSMDGEVIEMSAMEAEKTWNRLPRSTKIIFMTSDHPGKITSYDLLEERKEKLETLYPKDIPMPNTFTGYHILPTTVIFYEIKSSKIPEKSVAHFEKDTWTTVQVEP